MLRAFCSAWDGGERVPSLDREETHHLLRVRRVRAGETIEILNGRGAVARCEVTGAAGRELELAVRAVERRDPAPLQLHLLVALPKGKTFPNLLHKAVELGVAAITPLLTTHVEAEAARLAQKQERWEAILIEALKQSGNPWLPRLEPLTGLTEALAAGAGREHQRVCAALQPGARPLWAVLGDSLQPRGVLQVFVGPEGDFTAAEYDLLRAAGCRFVTLGPLVLKVETAASLVAGAASLWAQAVFNCHPQGAK